MQRQRSISKKLSPTVRSVWVLKIKKLFCYSKLMNIPVRFLPNLLTIIFVVSLGDHYYLCWFQFPGFQHNLLFFLILQFITTPAPFNESLLNYTLNLFSDSWENNWIYSKHPGKEFGKFVLSAGEYHLDPSHKGLKSNFYCTNIKNYTSDYTFYIPNLIKTFTFSPRLSSKL